MEKKDSIEKTIEAETEIESIDNQKEEVKKKQFTIFGFTIWRLLAYFIIYSIIGYIIETLFCIARYGVWESRQSFLYGPFCSIYGLGAVVIILCLHHFKKNYNTIFIGGCIVGSILEYVISWVGEKIFNVRWWDYSQMPLNLNGRICLLYSIFWGGLALYLMISLNPKVDKLIDWFKKKINVNILKTVIIVLVIGMIIDAIITAYAITAFRVRIVKEYNIDVPNKAEMDSLYEYMYSNEKIAEFTYKHFDDKTMLTTFPRLKIESSDQKIIYFSSILTDIQPYYYKVWEPNFKLK